MTTKDAHKPRNRKRRTEEGVVWGRFSPADARTDVLGELHARPFEPLPTPRRIYHFAFLTNEAQARSDRAAIAKLARAHGVAPPAADAKFHRLELPRWRLRWEQHTEFTTYTWDAKDGNSEAPFVDPEAGDLRQLSFAQPGPLLVAVHINLVRAPGGGTDYEALFHPASLCVVSVEGGGGRIASDFKVDSRGFTRFLIENHKLDDLDAGVLAQRVLELETYRTLALLGLPIARKTGSEVRRIETELATLTRAMARADDMEANRALLKRLTTLAAELEAQAVEASYRFGASRAYDELVQARLAVLAEEKIEGQTRLSAFLARRLNPAMRTCNAVDERQTLLSVKLMRTADLLRTRIQFELEEQNRDLLQSMNRRARLQLRLQQTVEGLSVAAISYYLVGLVAYLAKGAEAAGLRMPSPNIVAAVAVPAVVLFVWWLVHRVRRTFIREDGPDSSQSDAGG